MLRRMAPDRLQHIGKPDQIAMRVRSGVLQAVADARLRAQMHHVVRPELVIDGVERRRIRKVRLHETEPLGLFQLGQARPLQLDRIIVVEIIDPQHLRAVGLQQPLASMIADEPGRSGDENLHAARG